MALVSRLDLLLNITSTYTVSFYINKTIISVIGPIKFTRSLIAGLGEGNSANFRTLAYGGLTLSYGGLTMKSPKMHAFDLPQVDH